MKLTHFLKVFSLSLLLLLGSCGQNGEQQQIVKDVNVLTSLENGDVYLSVAVQVQIGTTNLSAITLPIYNYTDPESPKYGEISFRPTLTPGLNEIKIKANLSASAEVSGGWAKLPNGADLPIAGINESDVIQLQIDKIHSRIYLALQQSRALFGFAVAIKEFERLNGKIPGANIFLGFDIKGVLGSVGIFTGDAEYESGLAFFLDISKYFSGDVIDDLLNGREVTEEALMATQSFRAEALKADVREAFGNKNITARGIKNLHRFLEKMEGRTLHYVDK